MSEINREIHEAALTIKRHRIGLQRALDRMRELVRKKHDEQAGRN